MELSETQKDIITGLKLCGISKDGIIAMMTFLETEEQQEKMLDWMIWQDEAPTEQKLLRKIVEIRRQN